MNMPKLLGILNITPDSFSDGGRYNTIDTALAHAASLIADGAHIIDVGAESTRPGAVPLSAEQEWARSADILTALIDRYKKTETQISFDSRHAVNAEKAIKLGVDWINDVSGADDLQMQQVLKAAGDAVKLVVMHHKGIPADKMVTVPEHEDVVDVVYRWAQKKIEQLEKAGIARSRIILDPGIGFGKTPKQSLQLIKHIDRLHLLGSELLVGHSRKSFLKPFYGDDIATRDEGTLIASAYLAQKKTHYLRVHNVKMHQAGLALAADLF